jgi:hypothetical protein
MPGVAPAGLRTPLASIQPATKRKQHLLFVIANQQPLPSNRSRNPIFSKM